MAAFEYENERVENILRFENILRLKNVLWRWGQVKLQYIMYIYNFKNLLLELLKITQEGWSKFFWTGIWGGVNFENE